MACSWTLRAALCGIVAFSGGATGTAHAATATTTTAASNKYYDSLVASLPSLRGRCVAITGTTSGLGYWAAVAAAKKGTSCLIMLNRKSNRSVAAEEKVKHQAAPGVSVVTVTCDLENITSVRDAAMNVNRIAATFGGLDVLALNAGIMSQPDKRTADGYDVMMQTNHLSHFLLTKLLMPSLHQAATARGEVRIVTHSSLARGTSEFFEGGGPVNSTYYVKSSPGSLGGDVRAASKERYHQSKLANIVFAMAMNAKFKGAHNYSKFKALAAAPGFADTDLKIPAVADHQWIKDLIALSAPDGSCSLLTAMFSPMSKSGDFYEPERLSNGPPIKVISEGYALPPVFPRGLAGIDDQMVCDDTTLAFVWETSEAGLGEDFIIGAPQVRTFSSPHVAETVLV